MFSAPYSLAHAIVGGAMIGLASLLVILATGRPLGISGMFSRCLFPQAGDWLWRGVFFAGLLAGAALAFHAIDGSTLYRPGRPVVAIAVAGVLVGFGTRLSGGCTSGHGVCGLSLGSRNSLVATLAFMGAGILMVGLLRLTGVFTS